MNSIVNDMMIIAAVAIFASCQKKGSGIASPVPVDTTVVIAPAVDPPLASSIGFFMDDWQPKTFAAPANVTNTSIRGNATVTVTIDRSHVLSKIPRSLFGNNANTWMTQIVTEPVLMDHIRSITPHIIRFPGGSISDLFFWNAQPGSPPADAPSQLLNAGGNSNAAGYWFGKNSANWTLSVDNYYALLQQTSNQGLITINYGYARYGTGPDPVAAAAHLAADWVRYDNGRTKYWEIGNENYGDWEAGYRIRTADNKDGQPEFLSGQLYGQHVRVIADSMRKAAAEINKTIHIGAVLSESAPQSWWTPTATNWNSGLLSAAAGVPDYYVVHNYYTPYNTNSGAGDILQSALTETKKMMDYVKQTLLSNGAAIKPIVLDEWNIFAVNSRQQVSHVNGLHGVLVLGELMKNQFGMGARWDLANGWDNGNDHGMFNIGDEPDGVPRWNPRPSFYQMYFFQKFLGDRLVQSSSTSGEIISYASSYSSGEVAVALVNKSASDQAVNIDVSNFRKGNRFYWYTLTGGDNSEFSRKVLVNGVGPSYASGGPANYKTIPARTSSTAGGIRLIVPSGASVFLVIEKP